MTAEEKLVLVQKSAKEAFFTVYNGLATFFGGGIVVFTFFSDQSFLTKWQSLFVGLGLYVLVFLIVFNVKFVKNLAFFYSSKNRKNIYGESVKYMNAAFAIIHELQRMNTKNGNEILLYLTSFCTQIQAFFTKKAAVECSVSIKLMITSPAEQDDVTKLEVITLCRDRHNISRRESKNDNIRHYVGTNTCYENIVSLLPKNEGRYYLNNNLVHDSGYKNSSTQYYGNLPKSVEVVERAKRWPLPYRSELVVPIMPLKESESNLIKGFFCVDCEKENVFNVDYDPELVMGIADGLFNVLMKYSKVLNRR